MHRLALCSNAHFEYLPQIAMLYSRLQRDVSNYSGLLWLCMGSVMDMELVKDFHIDPPCRNEILVSHTVVHKYNSFGLVCVNNSLLEKKCFVLAFLHVASVRSLLQVLSIPYFCDENIAKLSTV
jgi:hypothetical protein